MTPLITDNFLEPNEFQNLQILMFGEDLPWYYMDKIDYLDDKDRFQFTHAFYDNDQGATSEHYKMFDFIFEEAKATKLYRIKANLLTRTSSIQEYSFHTDIGDLNDSPEKLKQWTTSIFYINTNNGYTKFEDGTKVESVANRMVTFPANMKHCGTSCTDEKKRIVINFNYFEITHKRWISW